MLTQSKSQGLTLTKKSQIDSSLFRQCVNNTGKSFITLLTGADPAKIVRSTFTHSFSKPDHFSSEFTEENRVQL